MQKIKTFFRTNKSFLIKMCMFALIVATFIIHIPFTASAYSTYPYNVTISNPDNIPIDGSIQINYYNNGDYFVDAFGTHTITRELYIDDVYFIESYTDEYGVPCFDLTSGALTFTGLGYLPTGYYVIDYVVSSYDSTVALAPIGSDGTVGGVVDMDFGDLGVVGMYIMPNTYTSFVIEEVDVNIGDFQQYHVLRPVSLEPDPEPTCPTLTDYIEEYTGSWSQFRNAYINPDVNHDLYWGWKNERDDVFATGKLSVTGDFINFNGTYEELLQLLMTTSNDNPNIQAALEQELQRQFENGVAGGYDDGYSDGKDYGQEVGYKDGYANGLNKGQSDTFTQSFFTDFLGGVVDAIDSIHLYEHIRQIDGGVSTVVEWYISPWTIFTAMTCLIVVIIILKVWLGG